MPLSKFIANTETKANAGQQMYLATEQSSHPRMIAALDVLEIPLKSAVSFWDHERRGNFGMNAWLIQTIGGSDRLSVYSTTTTTPPSPPAHVPTAGPYTRIGCYTEGNGTRALSGATKIDYSTTTVETCATFCNTEGFAVMGVEYGGVSGASALFELDTDNKQECYCGSEASFAASGSVLAPETECNMLCAGSPSEFCGSGNRLDTYHIPPPPAPPGLLA